MGFEALKGKPRQPHATGVKIGSTKVGLGWSLRVTIGADVVAAWGARPGDRFLGNRGTLNDEGLLKITRHAAGKDGKVADWSAVGTVAVTFPAYGLPVHAQHRTEPVAKWSVIDDDGGKALLVTMPGWAWATNGKKAGV